MKNVGLCARRLKDPLHAEELRFAEAWERESALPYLIGKPNERTEPSDRDRAVAATVIQWLGSGVGQAFLAGLGYRRERP